MLVGTKWGNAPQNYFQTCMIKSARILRGSREKRPNRVYPSLNPLTKTQSIYGKKWTFGLFFLGGQLVHTIPILRINQQPSVSLKMDFPRHWLTFALYIRWLLWWNSNITKNNYRHHFITMSINHEPTGNKDCALCRSFSLLNTDYD